MAELVVSRALLPVAQDLKGLFGLLEFILRFRVTFISIGVVLHGQAAIGLFDVGVIGVAINAENFVIVTLSHVDYAGVPYSSE